jgi:hypothetical protein
MVAEIVFLAVFFTLGTGLLLMTHYALVSEQAGTIARLERTPALGDGAMQEPPESKLRDCAA